LGIFHCILISIRRFLISTMLAPSIPEVLQELRRAGNDSSLGSFAVTVYILGFIVGPFLFRDAYRSCGSHVLTALYSDLLLRLHSCVRVEQQLANAHRISFHGGMFWWCVNGH
jgi:hypothetical protein